MGTREITGRQVFMVTAGAFGVIIAVNVFMAWNAIATFPGVEARNSYVASQEFEAARTAQEALGWTVGADVSGGSLILSIRDRDGRSVEVRELSATLGRATTVADDRTPEFTYTGRDYVAATDIGTGNWNLRLAAVADDGTAFRQRIVIRLK